MRAATGRVEGQHVTAFTTSIREACLAEAFVIHLSDARLLVWVLHLKFDVA